MILSACNFWKCLGYCLSTIVADYNRAISRLPKQARDNLEET